jgi:Long-chain acyl-CoA synthetases (AMP-forming)
MPNFLENIFTQLQQAAERVVLREVRGREFASVTGRELLEQISRARAYLRQSGVQPGDRCAILGPNSIQWAALDVALMAEGAIVVPLYSRQAPAELAVMIRDCSPRLLFVSDAPLGEALAQAWPEAPPRISFGDALGKVPAGKGIAGGPNPRRDNELVTIIYTSGTSGEPKGVCLNTGNLNHMLSCTAERLDQLMGRHSRAGPRLSLLAVQFCGLLDSASELFVAREHADSLDGFEPPRRRDSGCLRALLHERAHLTGARQARRRRCSFQAQRSDPRHFWERACGLASQGQGTISRVGYFLAAAGEQSGLQ